MARRVSSRTFIGREHELKRLDAAIDQARNGQPAVVLLAGEAGVGKSRFVSEMASRARAVGARVLLGGSVQIGGEGIPFEPLVEAFRGITEELPSGELDELLGAGRIELARLLPELVRSDGSGGPDQSSERPTQGRLFEHIVLFLGRLARRAPVVFVVEDVHWADPSTLDLLRFLARNLRSQQLVLVITYRNDELHRRHPLPPVLAELGRSEHAERLELRRFDRAETTAQLEGILGAHPERDLVELVLARSDGNAFHVEELVAAGVSADRLPASLREAMLERVSRLTEPAQDLVAAASAAGPRISADLLGAVLGISDRAVEAGLREAVAEHVLVPSQDLPERYSFRHALIQEAVYSDLIPNQRTRLHAAFARALSRDAAEPNGSFAAELAFHWHAAGDSARAFEASVRAGLAAEAMCAFPDAAVAYERALALWDQVPDAASRSPLDQVDLLAHAARAVRDQAPSRSLEYARMAIALVDPAIDPTRSGVLRLTLSGAFFQLLDHVKGHEANTEAVRLVPADSPSAARAEVVAQLGRNLAIGDRHAESAALCEEAIAIARIVGDRSVESHALDTLGLNRASLGDIDGGMADIVAARLIAESVGNSSRVNETHLWMTHVLLEAGRYDEAVAAGFAADAHAVRNGLSAQLGNVDLGLTAEALTAQGRWDEAIDALALAERYGLHAVSEIVVGARRGWIEAVRGEFETAARRLERLRHRTDLVEAPWLIAPLICALAEVRLWRGDTLAAQELLREAMDVLEPPDVWIGHAGPILALALRAEADLAARPAQGSPLPDRTSAHDGDHVERGHDAGAELLDRMQQIARDTAERRPAYSPQSAAWLATCAAEFSRLVGEWAPDRWALAAEAWDAIGVPYAGAYTRWREAQSALAMHHDRVRAAAAMDAAHPIARALGAAPLRHEIEILASRASIRLGSGGVVDQPSRIVGVSGKEAAPRDGISAASARPGSDRLTPRELEVLQLLAAGHSNDQIADALFISKKTASVHIANIKGKLQAANRVEIVTNAMWLGVVAHPAPQAENGRP